MAETGRSRIVRRWKGHHRGRGEQVWIYLGKMLRMFVYQSDWKVLPMAALIAGLVGMVVRRRFFINMEGTLMGAFAIVCVCIWNGCFNSIQVICRERDVIKREHRSGMHISSYIFSHTLYQALLCLAQTGVTLYVTRLTGVKYPSEGLITPWFLLDIGISMFLITFASDMLSLWVSTLAKNTTTAMTIMPFVLIFQLVFSGGMLKLPAWTDSLTPFTISNPGLKVIAAQADTNHRPFVTVSDMVGRMRDNEIRGEITLGQALDTLSDAANPTVAQIRAIQIGGAITVGELKEMLDGSATIAAHRGDAVGNGLTVGEALDLLNASGLWEHYRDAVLETNLTVGEVVDRAAANPDIQARRDKTYTFATTLGGVLDIVGEAKVRTYLEERAAAASYVADYENTWENIVSYWLHLAAFIIAFAMLSTITLEFIDKDKR